MGSSGRYYFTVIAVLYFGATILLQNLVSSRDLHQEVACYRDRLRINCGDHSFIAIHEAFFTTQVQDNTTCGGPSAIEHEHPLIFLPPNAEDESKDEAEDSTTFTDPTEEEVSSGCHEDIRVSMNKKCSGSRSCDYSYHEQTNKKCPNMRGEFVVRYDCVRNNSLDRFCNTKLATPEGYFSSPGFPQFYPHLTQCGWTISSSEGQTILLKILHLNLRPPTDIAPTPSDPDSFYAQGILAQMVSEEDFRCELDSLTIFEGNVKRASVCGESPSALRTLEVEGGQAEVNFKTGSFEPRSGFLMYYKIQGCPTLSSPDGSSHLVEGNSSVSTYACKGDRVFNDTLESERYLSCVRDHHWNDTLPTCISLEEIATATAEVIHVNSEAAAAAQMENSTLPIAERTTVEAKQAAYIEDIIIPSVIIGILLVANAIIVATILIIKRRQKAKLARDDENDDPKSEPLVPDVKDV